MAIEKKKRLLPESLKKKLTKLPESGMGYQVVKVVLKDGCTFDNVIIVNCSEVIGIYGYKEFPFAIEDIIEIEVTHLRKPENFDPKKWLYLDR